MFTVKINCGIGSDFRIAASSTFVGKQFIAKILKLLAVVP